MKKYLKFILILLPILFCILIINFIKDKKETDNSNQDNEPPIKEIMKYTIVNEDDNDKYTIYYYGINSATIHINNKTYEFDKSIQEKQIALDEILNEMEIYAELNDGGTKIYRNNNNLKYFNDNYIIIKCNTIDNNKDIYIGDSTMKYVQSFCKFDSTEPEIKLQIEVLKLLNTNKIKVVPTSNNQTKKIITNKNKIRNIIDIISRTNETSNQFITTSEDNSYNLLMYDKNDELISTISIWNNGYLGFENNKAYYISSKNDINTIKDLVEY